MKKIKSRCGDLVVFVLLFIILFLAVFLLNGAGVFHADILSFVSVGHVVENTRLVHVDGEKVSGASNLPSR